MRTLALAVIVAGSACARTAPPHATTVDAERGNVELADLEHGRTLLVRKCGGSCHQTPLPSTHGATQWPVLLGEMAERAHVDPTERRLILNYLVVMAQAPQRRVLFGDAVVP